MAAAATAKKRYRTPGVVNGSLAYDFGALERQLENTGRMAPDLYSAPLEETAADVISRAHENTKAKIRPAQHLSPVMVLGYAAVAALMVLLVLAYVELASISGSVVSMQEELTALETENVSLMTEYEQAFDLASVKEAAAAAGMSQPSDSQIYYIDLSEPDSATVYSQGESGVRQIFSLLGEGIRAAVEYFR